MEDVSGGKYWSKMVELSCAQNQLERSKEKGQSIMESTEKDGTSMPCGGVHSELANKILDFTPEEWAEFICLASQLSNQQFC